MLNQREKTAFHRNATLDGRPLNASEREGYMKRFLPPTPSSDSPPPSRYTSRSSRPRQQRPGQRKKPIRTLIKTQVYVFLYTLIHAFFGIYVRLRRAYHAVVDRILATLYYHHRTPEMIQRDIRNLSKKPQHLSVILSLGSDDDRGAGLEALLNDVGEIAAWCASAGIPELSVYEKTGILKHYIPQTHHIILRTLQAYFGNTSSARCPTASIRAPNQPSFSPPTTPPSLEGGDGSSRAHLAVLLLSEDDGRNTIVDLTKTLADMAQKEKISPDNVNYELIDAEITESVMPEPDLLLMFGPRVVLEGYPPWQLRLTEIFHVPDNLEGVGYQVFLRALHRYAKAQMRFGR